MTNLSRELNETIRTESPALHSALSELGRRAAFPPDIPFQAAEARDKKFNATIGQITDGKGLGLPVAPIDSALNLPDAERNRALLYSPVQGIQELREAWRIRQRRQAGMSPSSVPLVTAGLTHGLSIVADLFADADTAVATPAPFWGNYRQTFALRRGARVMTAPAYREGSYNPSALAEALGDEPDGRPAIAMLNLPSNPGGYTATVEERQQILSALLEVAERRPLVVVCDDAYAGLVYEDALPARSMFWDLMGRHENLIPIKIDGGTKEFDFFGGRVGFITFPFDAESAIADALENKVKSLIRSTIGSPVATSQMLLLRALQDDSVEDQIDAIRERLRGRYRTLKESLLNVDLDLIRPLPFNSGCFALVQLPESLSLDPNLVRRHLLDRHDTGLVSIAPSFLRLAFCSVSREALPEVVERLETGVREMSRIHPGPPPGRL